MLIFASSPVRHAPCFSRASNLKCRKFFTQYLTPVASRQAKVSSAFCVLFASDVRVMSLRRISKRSTGRLLLLCGMFENCGKRHLFCNSFLRVQLKQTFP